MRQPLACSLQRISAQSGLFKQCRLIVSSNEELRLVVVWSQKSWKPISRKAAQDQQQFLPTFFLYCYSLLLSRLVLLRSLVVLNIRFQPLASRALMLLLLKSLMSLSSCYGKVFCYSYRYYARWGATRSHFKRAILSCYERELIRKLRD